MPKVSFKEAATLLNLKYTGDADPEKGRIRISPNPLRTYYLYKSIPFFYATASHLPETVPGSVFRYWNIADNYAEFRRVTHALTDNTGRELSFSYYLVNVWDQIDEEFRDMFLIHELSEMQHRKIGKQSREIAHQRAVRKTEDYIRRYLSPKESARFQTMLAELPERRKRPSGANIIIVGQR